MIFEYRIKQARSNNVFFQMHLNALFDICENRYITAVTQPRPKMNETQALCHMVDHCNLPENTILIADRGYASLNTMAHLIEKKEIFSHSLEISVCTICFSERYFAN